MTTTAGLGLLLISSALIAQPGAPGAGDHERHDRGLERLHERRLDRMTQLLDLSEQQVEQWRQVHGAYSETAPAQRREMHALHERIREMASADDPDPTAVGELVIRAHELKEQGRAEREAMHEELLTILTPDQQERFELMREMRPERGRHGRHGRRGGRHGARSSDAG